MLLQKYFRNNHIEKKKTRNNGELPKYLVKNAHEAIIDRDTFQKVQELIAKRQSEYSHIGSKNRYPLSGMIQCRCCGKNYQRKVFKQGSAWICATYATRGKKYCPTAKQIPEDILYDKCCEILQLDEFDTEVFQSEIESIIVPEPNVLTFVFKDGHKQTVHWLDHSRSEAWTPEMRAKASENSRKRGRKWKNK